MADEATITSFLTIEKNNISYRSQPSSFTANVTGTKGPAPGAVAISTSGVNIDLTEFTTPALCRIQNLDSTNFVEVGIYVATTFYPLTEVLAGESYVIRLSRNIGTLRAKADTAACDVIFEIFET